MKPEWIRVKAPSGDTWKKVDRILKARGLHTVCDEANCPNKGECWGMGTATFMILGDICTRGCKFCAVATSKEGRPIKSDEGNEISLAVEELKLDYVVLTSVDRDDLADRGAGHFASCIKAVKEKNAWAKVEVLIPDYYGEELALVIEASPDVVAHNIETVPSLQYVRDARASFDKSLRTLSEAYKCFAGRSGLAEGRSFKGKTKSSILLGLGEKQEEVFSAMDCLREAGVEILVMGQYLQPSKNQIPVAEYVTPDQFKLYREEALSRGFLQVVSSPLARTSYHAKLVEQGANAEPY
jgi:lipoic acid synthetase